MKKSTILTFATAAAVLATSAGTFAAWDVTNVSDNVTLQYRAPVKITETLTKQTAAADYALGADADPVSIPVSLNIENPEGKATKLVITPKVETASNSTDITSKVDIVVKDDKDAVVNGNTVSDPTTGEAKYTVVITNKTTGGASYEDLNSAKLTVTAELK